MKLNPDPDRIRTALALRKNGTRSARQSIPQVDVRLFVGDRMAHKTLLYRMNPHDRQHSPFLPISSYATC